MKGVDYVHKSQTGDEFWNVIKEDIIKLYTEDNWSANKIGEKYNCAGGTIRYKLKEWDIPTHKRYNAIYRFDNTDYFTNIDDEHKAYWYGFILADGHVNERMFTLALQKRDSYLLDILRKDLGTDIPLRIDYYGTPTLSITCKEFCNILLEKGFHHRKSYGIDILKIASYVPSYLINHFVRGMFDGDGCIAVYKYEYFSKPQYHFGYTGLLNVCQYIADQLCVSFRMVKEGDVTYTAVTRDPQIINSISDYLYKDATIYMDRKKKKFEEIKLMTVNDYNSDNQFLAEGIV